MSDEDDEGGVTINIGLGGGDFGTVEEREQIAAVENTLIDVLERAGVGSVDGDAFGEGEALVFLVGADEDRLAAICRRGPGERRPAGGLLAAHPNGRRGS